MAGVASGDLNLMYGTDNLDSGADGAFDTDGGQVGAE